MYLNNLIEADHGKLKILIKPVRGFKSIPTAYATIKGFEVMRALRKGQARPWCLQPGIWGEVRLLESAFGMGPSALTEAKIGRANVCYPATTAHLVCRHPREKKHQNR